MTHQQYIDAITYIMKHLSKKWDVIIHYANKKFIVIHNKKELFRCNEIYEVEPNLKLYLS